ncbi:MAG: asparagine synthase [Bacteroidales bacterium]|nr:asparagine synthase [Bacteroidales bacterium]
MIDTNFCMSSYLAFRYIIEKQYDFFEGLHHENYPSVPENEMKLVGTAREIDAAIEEQIAPLRKKKCGILLSGGMDSAIVASYLPGIDAYTFRFLGGEYQKDELERAQYYAKQNNMRLHYVDIDWSVIDDCLDVIMQRKGAPVHSIEPQIYAAAKQAKNDGIELMFIGDGSDYVFGGMDGLLSKDWDYDAWIRRFIYLNPEEILRNPVDVTYVFEKYKRAGGKVDFQKCMDDIATEESYGSYSNAFETAGLAYFDPYAIMKMSQPLDLKRVRNGESKYLIRELFSTKYPDIPVPNKLPMPRPVDIYFANWEGPKRKEFRSDLNMTSFSGNQKWLLYCLERFLNLYSPENK